MVRISGFHPEGPGSTPGDGIVFSPQTFFYSQLRCWIIEYLVHIYIYFIIIRGYIVQEKNFTDNISDIDIDLLYNDYLCQCGPEFRHGTLM